MTYKTTIKEKCTTGSKVRFNMHNAMTLRESVIQQIGSYCAELSQLLMINYAEKIASQLVAIPLNDDSYAKFLAMENCIQSDGLFNVGQQVLDDMRSMLKA